MTNINDLLKNIQEFNVDYGLPTAEDSGKRSIIYRVSENEVAKIPRWIMRNYPENNTCTEVEELLERLIKEKEIAKYLANRGVNVPEQKGLFFIDFNGIKIPGLVMERIPGKSMLSIYLNEEKEKRKPIEKIWKHEIKKLKGLKEITPYDETHRGNAIYNPTNQKVYLIDFEAWSFK